jgi:hypothetical protein
VVLFGAYLRAFALLDTDAGTTTITTPQLYFPLTAARPPKVTVRQKPQMHAIVHRPTGAIGPLFSMMYRSCRLPGEGVQVSQPRDWRDWSSSSENIVSSGCRKPVQWEVLAGWEGHSVVRIQYQAAG